MNTDSKYQIDPYAPPEVSQSMSNELKGFAHTDGKFLYLHKGFKTQPYCIMSGEAVDPNKKIIKKRLAWYPPLAILLIFLGIIGIIILLVLQKTHKFEFYLSEAQEAKYKTKKMISMVFTLVGVLLIVLTFLLENSLFIFLGLLVLIVAMIVCGLALPLRVKGFKKGYFKVNKVHPDFLKHVKPMVNDVY